MAECDRAGDRAGAFAHGVSVVTALNDPLRAGAPGDDADVMAPHHHRANARTARVAADPRPVAREPEIAPRHAKMLAEPPAAPRRRTSARTARRTHARAMPMAAHAMPHMVLRTMRMRCVMDGVLEVPVRTRFCAGVRES